MIANNKDYKTRPDMALGGDRNTTPKEKIKMIRGLDAEHKKWAKELMLFEFPDLRAVINQRDSYEKIRGRNPSMILPPSPEEIEAAEAQNERAISPFGIR